LEELLHGFLLEEVAISGEFISDVLGADLCQSTCLSIVGEGTSDILSKESDDLKSVLVVSKGLNEEGVGEASHLSKACNSLGDLSKSALSPYYPSVGISNLGFDVFSGGLGIVEVILIDVSYHSQFGDDVGTDLFVGRVLLISGYLNIQVFGLKVSQQIVHRFNGVICSSTGLNQSGEL
jgi:hypothetical protein